MISFFSFIREERSDTLVLHYGRMNPVTQGHEENVHNTVKMAAKLKADHLIVASHSQDSEKNPLSPEQKIKHLRRAFPKVNVEVATKAAPTIMDHASRAHAQGYQHLVVTAGEDRAEHYSKLLHKYNGVPNKAGKVLYNFKSIKVVSTGARRQGVSGTDMRRHATSGNYEGFKSNLPSRIRSNESYARELYNDTRSGLKVKESSLSKIRNWIFG